MLPKDTEGLTDAMKELIGNRSKIESMGAESRRMVEEKFEEGMIAETIVDVMRIGK